MYHILQHVYKYISHTHPRTQLSTCSVSDPDIWSVPSLPLHSMRTERHTLTVHVLLIKSCLLFVTNPATENHTERTFSTQSFPLYLYQGSCGHSAYSVQIYDFRRHVRSHCSPSQQPWPPFKVTVYSTTEAWPPDIFFLRYIWNLTGPHVIILPIIAHLTYQTIGWTVVFSGLSVNRHRNKREVVHHMSLNTILFLSHLKKITCWQQREKLLNLCLEVMNECIWWLKLLVLISICKSIFRCFYCWPVSCCCQSCHLNSHADSTTGPGLPELAPSGVRFSLFVVWKQSRLTFI